MEFLIERLALPLGEIVLVSDGKDLRALDFADYEERMLKLLKRHYGEVALKPGHNPGDAATLLNAYLDGDIAAIERVTVATNGTPFQKLVWQHLRRIPKGKTCGYGELASAVGKPTAARAVGLANGSNPIAIVVPCHRVIGANGNLTGYAGGVQRKTWLLQHEGALML
jgi:O-6-methylguanine DNA methyltransferase